MSTVNLYFKDKMKFLRDAYTSAGVLSRNVREYIDQQLPERFRSSANIFNLAIDVVDDLSTVHLLHYEDAVNESNIYTAQHDGNIRGLSQLSGHTPVLPISSRGVVKMSVIKPALAEFGTVIYISPDAVFKNTSNGKKYCLRSLEKISFNTGASFKHVELIQGVRDQQHFVVDVNSSDSKGRLYTINLDATTHIEHYSVRVYVNNKLWSKKDMLYDMHAGDESYIQRVGYGNQLDIHFGTGSHGKQLQTGDTIRVEYLSTDGSAGNVEFNSKFVVSSGFVNSSNVDISVSEYLEITKESGFDLGSDGEHIETTRAMAGFSSRTLSFARPENIIAYLSRLSTLSHINAWTLENDLVFNILALPRLLFKSNAEYLTADLSKFKLSKSTKSSIKKMLEHSRRQWVSTEFVFHDPALKKYVVMLYIDGQIYDKQSFKNDVEDIVATLMLSKTYNDVDKDASSITLTNSEIINKIHDMPAVDSVHADILSEDNENARIRGYYYKTENTTENGVLRTKRIKVDVDATTNPAVGLSEIGDIATKKTTKNIPIIRGGFRMYQQDGNHADLQDNGVMIFIKQDKDWTLI